jgi:superfamily II DNA or RNA helicase
MIGIIFDYDTVRKKAIIQTDYLQNIRQHFSVEDKTHFFKKRRSFGYQPPSRLYAITPQGRFEPYLYPLIEQYLKSENIMFTVQYTDKFKNAVITDDIEPDIKKLKLDLRDYQKESVQTALTNNNGVIILPTSAGKTLVMASICTSIQEQKKVKALILVPDIQLVQQTHGDFIEYGIPESRITKWTGSDTPNFNASIFVSNMQILLSKKQDLSLLKDIELLIVDECHKIKHGNEINKIIKQIPAKYRFGFTGTLPDNKIDQWNIFGHLGQPIYVKESIELRTQKYISDVNVGVIQLQHKDVPGFTKPSMDAPTAGYEEEITWLQTNTFRNNTIFKIANALNNNVLVLVDRIIHGETLYNFIKQNTDKKVYFVQGSVEIQERERIREIMETNNDVICIAISKIFSTGINIRNLHYIIFAAIGKAKIKIIQSIGRSLRLHANKKSATIFDISDNLRYSKQHLLERLSLYKEEKINFTFKEMVES